VHKNPLFASSEGQPLKNSGEPLRFSERVMRNMLKKIPGANPAIVSYNASGVKNNNAKCSGASLENKRIFLPL
jgi:hypothetical protein